MQHTAKEGEVLWSDGAVEIRVTRAQGGEVAVEIVPAPGARELPTTARRRSETSGHPACRS